MIFNNDLINFEIYNEKFIIFFIIKRNDDFSNDSFYFESI